MATGVVVAQGALVVVLAAAGRSPEIPESADCYGWLLGSWELDVRNYWGDVSTLGLRADLIGRSERRPVVVAGLVEITRDSFRWTGESLRPDGKTWTLEGEFRAPRLAAR